MRKIYCDICGKEIIRQKEVWKHTLTAKEGNKRISYDEYIEDICEKCAAIIHCCTSMMKQGFEPEYKAKETAAVAADGADHTTLLTGA